jgi:hypothetical protein
VVTHFGYTPMILFMGTLHLIALALSQLLLWRKPATH